MQNEVWSEIGAFLNRLRCGNIKRETYIQFPEIADAEKQKKELEMAFLKTVEIMDERQQQSVANYMEALKHLAFMTEEQAYCQGYIDCIQLLSALGMLEESPNIKELVEKIR